MTEEPQGFIRGEVVFTIYENSEAPFSIVKIKIKDTNEAYEEKEIVGKGNFLQLQKGLTYTFYGQLVNHPKFGLQYDIDSYKTYIPESKEAVIKYLSSDLFPGIGEKTATRIVEALGEQAVNKILQDKAVLDRIPNVSTKLKERLYKNLIENQGFERVAIEAAKYGVGLKMVQTLHQLYGEETLSLLKENPYRFVFDVEGFGFANADKIAEMNQLTKDDPSRIQASCYHALQEKATDGHVYLPREECKEVMKDILSLSTLSDATLDEAIDTLVEKELIKERKERLYLPALYVSEKGFSQRLQQLMQAEEEYYTTDAELMEIVGEIEEEEKISYGAEQYEAIKKAMQSPLMILTGGPGTGKTTVVKGIVKAYAKLHDLSLHRHDYKGEEEYPFILTAPTGRAAKRLEESTGLRAMTIHRLLGWDGNLYFEKNEAEPLQGRLLVIDEFSMVDIVLAYHLFKAIPEGMQVLIVGDEDQLPSVGPGQVLADLLASDTLPVVRLEEVYRQKEGSKIIDLAHLIKRDEITETDIFKEKDFSFIACEAYQVVDVLESIFERAKAKGMDLDNLQVLAPMYRTKAGIDYINRHLQALMNPKQTGKRERTINDVTYRVGDRVLQLVNQPEDGVYNGDIGKIIHILSSRETDDRKEKIVIQFDDKEVVYQRQDYLNFTLAYCISIHKAQGSEFPNVILPVVSQHRRMLRKNLLYTAITRSRDSLIVCGEMDAFMKGLRTIDTHSRYTTLHEYLTDGKEAEKAVPVSNTLEEERSEVSEDTDQGAKPSNLSPYDFL